MESHVVAALRDRGHSVSFITTRPSLRGFGRAVERISSRVSAFALREPERLVERAIVRGVAEHEPELVLVILGSELSPRTVARLRKSVSCPIVCWFQDALTSLGRQYVLGAGYDALFFKDRYLVDLFTRMIRTVPVHYLPEACNPRLHRPIPLVEADRRRFACDVMIAGSLYYYRQAILESLSEFDVRIWGDVPAWFVNRLGHRYQRHALYGEQKARAVQAARIALNTLHPAEVDGLNCRAFELAGFGAFQLISYSSAVAAHFVPGEEIETFRDVDELKTKVRHYLQRPELAASIAARGAARALAEHTYAHRLQRIFEVAGLAP